MARRETTENNFMAALVDGGCDEWEERTNSAGAKLHAQLGATRVTDGSLVGVCVSTPRESVDRTWRTRTLESGVTMGPAGATPGSHVGNQVKRTPNLVLPPS